MNLFTEHTRALIEHYACLWFGARNATLAQHLSVDRWVLLFEVPDMVPPLQKWRLTWSGTVIRGGGPAAMIRTFDERSKWFHEERETRRWSAVDL